MRRGAWHQFGDKSQKLAQEQLMQGAGVGVIISMRDIPKSKAIEYTQNYHKQCADVLIDPQFYNPDFSNRQLSTYAIEQYRLTISKLAQVTDQELAGLASELKSIHIDLAADGLIAPAVPYEAARPDIVQLNKRLFTMAKEVGCDLNIPTYATVILGKSITSSNQTVDSILSQATGLDCEGWYYGFEFGQERIPSSYESVLRCCTAGLTLACTGKPVLHAYAGPMALLSLGFGATGTGIGHSQVLWQFTRKRWERSAKQGGSGDAPPRFFSRNLWGTIVYPDEVVRLTPDLQNQVLIQSPFSTPTESSLHWSRWDANKHFVHAICSAVTEIAENNNARASAQAAISILEDAIELHRKIGQQGLNLRDGSNAYQEPWRDAMKSLLNNNAGDFDYLELLE